MGQTAGPGAPAAALGAWPFGSPAGTQLSPSDFSPAFRGTRQRATHLSTVPFHIWTRKCQRQVRSCVLASAAGHGAAGRALIRAALPVLAGRFQAPCQWASLFSQQGQQASSKQPHSCLLYRLCLARDCGPKGTTM